MKLCQTKQTIDAYADGLQASAQAPLPSACALSHHFLVNLRPSRCLTWSDAGL